MKNAFQNAFSLLVAKYIACKKGVAAVEFALIVPILLALYLASVEFSHVISADRKITNLANLTGDIVAQTDVTSDGEMSDIFLAAAATLAPYDTSGLEIIITSVQVLDDGSNSVIWSRADGGASAYAPGDSLTLPDVMTAVAGGLVVAEVKYGFETIFGRYFVDEVNLDDIAYLRPRRSTFVCFDGEACPSPSP